MGIFDKETEELRKEFMKKYNKKAPGINYDEFATLEEYKQYLKKLINKEE